MKQGAVAQHFPCAPPPSRPAPFALHPPRVPCVPRAPLRVPRAPLRGQRAAPASPLRLLLMQVRACFKAPAYTKEMLHSLQPLHQGQSPAYVVLSPMPHFPYPCKLYLQPEDEAHFLEWYATIVTAGQPAAIAELRKDDEVVRVTVDIDRKSADPPENLDRPVPSHVVTRIIESVAAAVRQAAAGHPGLPDLCFDLHTKPAYLSSVQQWKSGLHVVLHNVQFPRSHRSLLSACLANRLQWLDDGEAFDTSSLTAPWLLLGSSKGLGVAPYLPSAKITCMADGSSTWDLAGPLTADDITRCSVRRVGHVLQLPPLPEPAPPRTPAAPAPTSLRHLCRLVQQIRAAHAVPWKSWHEIVYAIKTESGGSEEGREVAHLFSKEAGAAYDAASVDALWDKPTDSVSRFTWGTLVHYAGITGARSTGPRGIKRRALLRPDLACEAPGCSFTVAPTLHRRYHEHFRWCHVILQGLPDTIPRSDTCALCRCRTRGCTRNPCTCT